MKLLHLSDLHIGKRVNEFSMVEDQRHILNEILGIIDKEQPAGVLLAGDIYDKSVPSAEAVALLDEFLVQLSQRKLQVFAISGNHDSPERIAFGGRLMEESGIHMAPVYNGQIAPIVLTDEFGPVNLYLLPFVKPIHVRQAFPEAEIESYTDALAVAVQAMNVDTSERNVLLTHQFVTGAKHCESEEMSVGGSDNVDVSVFDSFDYVALGHIHGPQSVGRETVRYCGTPLKYSFSEASHHKSVTVVELGTKGDISLRFEPLTPLHDMAEIKGSFQAVYQRQYCKGKCDRNDYLHITLTDEDDIPDAVNLLRSLYPNLMKLDYDNARTRQSIALDGAENLQQKSPLELLDEFYEAQNGQAMNDAQRAFSQHMMKAIWGETT